MQGTNHVCPAIEGTIMLIIIALLFLYLTLENKFSSTFIRDISIHKLTSIFTTIKTILTLFLCILHHYYGNYLYDR